MGHFVSCDAKGLCRILCLVAAQVFYRFVVLDVGNHVYLFVWVLTYLCNPLAILSWHSIIMCMHMYEA